MTMVDSAKSKSKRGIYLLPNLFTIGAMFAGFYSIIAATNGIFDNAAIAIFIAMVFDGLDGRVARLTHTQSEFGAQLDSLSDMVCFGLAPALVLYFWSLSTLGKAGWLVAFFYAVCTALRLARFNSQNQNENKRYFVGLSTPPAAALLASLIWSCTHYGVSGQSISNFVVVLTIILGLLKVSNIKYRSFKDFDMRGKVPFMVIIGIVLALVLISFDPADVLLALFTAFALSGPLNLLIKLKSKK